MEIDSERKKELLMEKKLRACRVNIIPRVNSSKKVPLLYLCPLFELNFQNEGYFQCPTPSRVRSPTPPPLTPSPEAVEKATNPIALRYWNQCLEKNADPHSPSPTPTPKPPARQPRAEVSKILSTSGTGIKRENEVTEARSNINRFITIDQVKKKDAVRVQRSQSQTRPFPNEEIQISTSRPYNLVKEEQIKLAQDRATFQSRSTNFVAKSPQPFRRGLSESRVIPSREARTVPVQPTTNLTSNLNNMKVTNNTVRSSSSSSLNLNNLSHEVLPNLNDIQKANLVQMLLQQLPQEMSDNVIGERLATISDSRLLKLVDNLPDKVKNNDIA